MNLPTKDSILEGEQHGFKSARITGE